MIQTASKHLYQVIVVDDVDGAAATYAELIEKKTALRVAATQSPTVALKLLSEHPVMVVVLDQILDQISPSTFGTELFKQLRQVSPDFAAVMLSARAELGDAGEATRLGYSAILDKDHVEDLPVVVRDLYYQQLAAFLTKKEGELETLVPSRRRFSLRWHRPAIQLVSLEIAEQEFVADSEWRTYVQISAGQTETREVTLTQSRRVELSAESRASFSRSLGLQVVQGIETKLEGAIESKIGRSLVDERSLTKRVSVTYSLPQPTDPSSSYIRTRNYEYAPIATRLRGVLLVSCNCCSGSTPHVVEILAATGRFASRHVDVASTGERQVVVTGQTL